MSRGLGSLGPARRGLLGGRASGRADGSWGSSPDRRTGAASCGAAGPVTGVRSERRRRAPQQGCAPRAAPAALGGGSLRSRLAPGAKGCLFVSIMLLEIGKAWEENGLDDGHQMSLTSFSQEPAFLKVPRM